MSNVTAYADFRPAEVSDLDLAFGGDFHNLAPMYRGYKDVDLPKEWLRHESTLWHAIVSQWFFGGMKKDDEFVPREGINGKSAIRHVSAILRSFEPAHEVKEAIAAYLLSLWFSDFIPSAEHSEQFRNRVARFRKSA